MSETDNIKSKFARELVLQPSRDSSPQNRAHIYFVILAKVTMGATILGLAGLLTLALGAAGFWGVLLSLAVATWKAFFVSDDK